MKTLIEQAKRIHTCEKELIECEVQLEFFQSKIRYQIKQIFTINRSFEIALLLSASFASGLYLSRCIHLLSKEKFLKLYAIFNQLKGWGLLFI